MVIYIDSSGTIKIYSFLRRLHVASILFLLLGAFIVGGLGGILNLVRKEAFVSGFITGAILVLFPPLAVFTFKHIELATLYFIVMFFPGMVTAIKFNEKSLGSPIAGFLLAFCVPVFGWTIMLIVSKWGSVKSNNQINARGNEINPAQY